MAKAKTSTKPKDAPSRRTEDTPTTSAKQSDAPPEDLRVLHQRIESEAGGAK